MSKQLAHDAAEPVVGRMISVTYSPEDNKLRLRSSGRLDPETYARVRAAGFIWAPKQGIFVAPMWTPEREDIAVELAGDIDDEDTTLAERAEERAERFEDYGERRADDAERAHAAVAAVADNIPPGQPILVGHHSERHARRDAKRIENGMRKAVRLWETSEYWSRRAAGALRHAKYKERPAVRARRIKGLEADLRKQQRALDEANKFVAMWSAPTLDRKRALAIANYDHVSVQEEGKPYMSSLWSMLEDDRIAFEAAAERAKAVHEGRIAIATRWFAHLQNRLAYERAMLGEIGGLPAERFKLELGGRVLVRREWLVILRLTRKGDAVVSVRTNRKYCPLVSVEEIEDYREPAEGDGAKIKAATKLPPLVNYQGEGFRQMTRAEWERRPTDFRRTAKRAATEKHGAHRQRETFVGGGNYNMVSVYITDSKRIELPSPSPSPAATPPVFERQVEAQDQRGASRALAPPSHADRLREQLRAGVQVVSAPELFPTPPELAKRVVELAHVRGKRVLEPSAGTGALALEALRQGAEMVRTYEINEKLCEVLRRAKYDNGSLCPSEPLDFLEVETSLQYERVVMNPPFSADVEHVTRALEMLAPGGKLVAIMSAGVKFRSERKYETFRELVASTGGTIEDLPDGSFSGTGVRTVLVQISKGLSAEKAARS